ncbi:MAG: FixH family protein [Gammaproteobacteria bacterium]|nr:FixH family protein [Gammaproteobacteria bacterium]
MTDAQPWHRNPWPWFLLALPLSVILAGGITAYLAYKDADGMVVDDYYKEGLAVNQDLERDRQAQALGMRAALRIENGQLRIRLDGQDRPAALKLHLEHPTRAELDREWLLSPDAGGEYSAEWPEGLSGRWHVQLSSVPERWRLMGDWTLEPAAELELGRQP